MTEVDDFLLHFGVKGMKWGKRQSDNGFSEPSAKQEAKKAKREIKAKDFESRAAKMDISVKEMKAELNALPPGVKTAYTRSQLKGSVKELTKYRDDLTKEAQKVRDGKLTQNQKLLIGGSIAAVGILGALYLSGKADSGELNSAILQGKSLLQGKAFGFKTNPAFSKSNMSSDEVFSTVVKGINPRYKEPGGAMNCRRTALTYELRRRGLDVVATTSSVGNGQSESGLINALTPGQKNKTYTESLSTYVNRWGGSIRGKSDDDSRSNPAETYSVKNAGNHKNLLEAFAKQPDGARGEVVFNFGMFGHAMAYEIFEGKPVIFDAQKATKYPVDAESMEKMQAKWGSISDAGMTRLDNIDLDMKFLARWATNA